jgi:hypothetical protein
LEIKLVELGIDCQGIGPLFPLWWEDDADKQLISIFDCLFGIL